MKTFALMLSLFLSHSAFAGSWVASGLDIFYSPSPGVITVTSVSYSDESGGESSSCGNYVQTQCSGKASCSYTGSDENCRASSTPGRKSYLFVTYSCDGISYSKQIEAGVVAKISCPGVGNVGVGTSTPEAKLDVKGEVKFGNSSSPCNLTNEGQQRYSSNSHQMEFCDGKAWTAYLTDASIKDLQSKIASLTKEVGALQKLLPPPETLNGCSINGFINARSLPSDPNTLVATFACPSH